MAQKQTFPSAGTIRNVGGQDYVSTGSEFIPMPTSGKEAPVATPEQTMDAPKERSWTDAAASTALRVVPAVAGGMAGTLAGPLAPYAVPALGAAGATLGEYLGNLYEGEDATPSELLTSALIGALPTGKLVAKTGQTVLRTIAPGVERKLAGALASKAAPSGARAFERLKSANVLGLAAKGAAQGAPTAAIENTVARTVQGQPTTLSDLGRDLATGAAAGGAFPVAVKAAQAPFRVMAPTAGAGVPKKLRGEDFEDTAIAQEKNAANRAAGLAEKPTAASLIASRGYTGSITQQQDRALADLIEANSRIDSMLSQPDLAFIPLSDSRNLASQLRSLAGYFKGSSDLEKMAKIAKGFASEVDGKVAVNPKLVHEVKKFLDSARNESSFAKDPSQLSAQAALVDLSDSVRGDLKTALPQIADLLDFQTGNYDILGGLYKTGAKGARGLSFADAVTLFGASGLTTYSPELGASLAAAGVARKAIQNSPRARARLGNIINRLAGNEYDAIPQVGNLPAVKVRGLLESGAPRITQYSSADDSSGPVPSDPFISRVIPRIEAGSAPPSANQAPPRTGGPNERGGFGGVNTMGQIIGEGQVPFNSGNMPLGGIPSRGNAPVQTMADRPPVMSGVVVDELDNAVGAPTRGTGDYIDAEVVPSATKALPRGVYAMPSGETPVSSTTQTPPPARSDYKTASEFREEARQKAEKLAESRQKLAPTVPAKPAAAKTVVQATTPKKVAVDTPKAAASEVTDEINRVIDVEGTTKAIEIKRRVLAALMEEMEPAKKAFLDWDTSGIDSKGRKVNIPPPYTQTITLTIPGDGTFRINRTPDAIAGVIKRLTKASSTAFEGLGSVTSTRKR